MWCKLDDLAFYKKGPFGSSLTKAMFVPKGDDTYKVYEQKNAIQKDCTLGTYYISKEKYDSLFGFSVQPFDIIVSCAGTIGETYVLPQHIKKGIINQALMLIRLYCREIEQFYLLYFDFILKEEANISSKGTAIKNIPPFDVLKNFYIPIPPLKEQRRILDEVNKWLSFVESIETSTLNLQDTIKQTKSKILDLAIHGKLVPQNPADEPASELLKRINSKAEIACDNEHNKKLPNTWCCPKINEVFTINPKNKVLDNINAGFVPMAYIDDGYRGTFKYEKRKWADIKIGFTHFADNDIAIAKISPCLENRKSMILKNLPNGIGAGTTELYVFRPLCVNPKYALYFFKSNLFIQHCIGTFNGVVGQQRVAKNIIKEIIFPLPPLPEQQRIVSKIEELFALFEKIEVD
ncbi:restriction endonuclease subunit S [Porphyromonas levii]|uniref:restriction endonuclease subunit S n=1 Tax=Porphyromonas levii TaxID=28114 RepID=UPI0031FF05A1